MKKIMFAWLFPLSFVAYADEPGDTVEEKSPWTGKAELGIVSTTGNTEASSSNGKINLVYEADKWRQEFRLEAYQAESEITDSSNQKVMQQTADRTYFLSKSDYKYTEKSYAYALVDYADENFTDKDYIANFSLGYGRTILKGDIHNLHGEIGYGLRRYQPKESVVAEEDEVVRIAGKYSWKVSKTANFSQELTGELGKEFDVYKSISALTVNINSSMALSVGYEVLHTTKLDAASIAAGIEKTDTKTTVNLVYNFL
jgi:putative salt-induced outer membrane protein YdiY